jgi:polysaccharide biosynthesis transport protein
LMLELLNRRVRSVEDLLEVIELPVLATISSAGRTAPRKPARKLFHRRLPMRAIGTEVTEH